jgi:hypothetical protein
VEDEPKHAQFPPSSLESFERCPGFRNRETTSQSSERGTRIHKALEIDKISDLPEKERPTAQVCKDFIDSYIAEHRPAVPLQDFREVKLQIDLGGDIKTFGTCDRLLIYETA